MNFKLRVKNPVTLVPMIVSVIGFIYMIFGELGIAMPVSEEITTKIALYIIDILMFVGIIVDPTTEGFGDSKRAKEYLEPYTEEVIEDDEEA